jgi:mono/diheme cytochrome c family protein
MKSVCLVTVLALLVAAPLSIWAAEDGSAIYKTKCANCHGEKGEGKPAMKMPAIKGTEKTVDQIVTYLTKGEEGKRIHANPISGLSQEQAKAVAECVKTLKK